MADHTIQYQDVNAGPASYRHMEPGHMLVSKIFYTVQGEGPYAGHPAVFVRLAGCNRGRKEDMGCRFCDTDFRLGNARAMSFADISREMRDAVVPIIAKTFMPLVVITGGEPMMQDQLGDFCFYLRNMAGCHQIQIESNGDRLAAIPAAYWLKLVVSPKASRDGYKPLRKDVAARADVLKFLIEDVPGSPYYQPPPWVAGFVGHGFTMLSPITAYRGVVPTGHPVNGWDPDLIDIPQTRANYQRAAALATSRGFRLSHQSHLFFGVE